VTDYVEHQTEHHSKHTCDEEFLMRLRKRGEVRRTGTLWDRSAALHAATLHRLTLGSRRSRFCGVLSDSHRLLRLSRPGTETCGASLCRASALLSKTLETIFVNATVWGSLAIRATLHCYGRRLSWPAHANQRIDITPPSLSVSLSAKFSEINS